MPDVIANRVADYEHAKSPGDFFFVKDEMNHLIQFLCPCGCGALGGINVDQANPNAWSWDGNEDQPTITPSVSFLSGCRWHGYLTAGVFKTV